MSAGANAEPVTQTCRESATRARSLALALALRLFAHPSERSEALLDGGLMHVPRVQRAVAVQE